MLLALVGLGVLVLGLGGGAVLAGVRMRRATGSWTGYEPVQQHGSGLIAIPVMLGFVVWLAPRFIR